MMSNHQMNDIDDEILDELIIDEIMKVDNATIMRLVHPSEIRSVEREIRKIVNSNSLASAWRPSPHSKNDDFQTFALTDGEKKRGGFKPESKMLMAAVLVGAVVTSGTLTYFYNLQTDDIARHEMPIITADSRPIRENPVDPGGREFPNGNKLIYERLHTDGGNEERKHGTEIARTDETAMGSSGTLEDRINNALIKAQKQEDTNPAATDDAPRPIRTGVLRPDGTLDSRVAIARHSDTSAQPDIAAAQPSVETIQAIPEVSVAGNTVSTADESEIFLQLGSSKNQAKAIDIYANLQKKYTAVLENYSPIIRKIDLGAKGVWYHLLIGPMLTKDEADAVCNKLKVAGIQKCFPTKRE